MFTRAGSHSLVFLVLLAPATLTTADVSLPAHASAKDDEPSCRAPMWTSLRRAVDEWCDGDRTVVRRYRTWSRGRTKRHACADLRDALAECTATFLEGDLDGVKGPWLEALYPNASLTYWAAHLERRGHRLRVTTIDFYEDCDP